jgi:hypothetical protein
MLIGGRSGVVGNGGLNLLGIGGGIVKRGHDLLGWHLKVGRYSGHGIVEMTRKHGHLPHSQARPMYIRLTSYRRVAKLNAGEIAQAQPFFQQQSGRLGWGTAELLGGTLKTGHLILL